MSAIGDSRTSPTASLSVWKRPDSGRLMVTPPIAAARQLRARGREKAPTIRDTIQPTPAPAKITENGTVPTVTCARTPPATPPSTTHQIVRAGEPPPPSDPEKFSLPLSA